uniref:RNase H type-1 domain-containing protein n=1 Tax=Chenopodium quinoa TaxID=63459 RepID=A0A803LLQ7_CHEQI
MVQALLCTQDWLRAKEVPIVDVEENLKELEEIEKEVQRGESNDVDDEVVFPKCLGGVLLALDYFLLAGDHFIQGYSIFDLGLSSKFDPQFLSPQVLSLYLRFQSLSLVFTSDFSPQGRIVAHGFLGFWANSMIPSLGCTVEQSLREFERQNKPLFLQLKENFMAKEEIEKKMELCERVQAQLGRDVGGKSKHDIWRYRGSEVSYGCSNGSSKFMIGRRRMEQGLLVSSSSWQPPRTGRVRVNTDAAILRGVGAGLGAAIRGAEGELIVVAVCRVKHEGLVAMAEAVAPGIGVLLACQLGFENIELECDALEVVKAICSRMKWRALYDMIIEDMCLLESSFTSVIMSKGVVMMLHT